MRNKFRRMKLRNKALLLTYMGLVPLLILICAILIRYRYRNMVEEEAQLQEISLDNLTSSLDIVQEDVRNLSLALSLNSQILQVIDSSDLEEINRSGQIWTDVTAVSFVMDQISLKEYYKTISIYPENGVKPFLRCLDHSAYVPDLEQLRDTDFYRETVSKEGKTLWSSVGTLARVLYQSTQGDKLVLSRAVYDPVEDRSRALITIGVSEDYIRNLCQRSKHREAETVILFDQEGRPLLREGNLGNDLTDEELQQYVRAAADGEDRTAPVAEGCFSFSRELPGGHWTVWKLVPVFTLWDVFLSAAYYPVLATVVMLLVITPVIIWISVYTTRPLDQVRDAMEKVQGGDFSQRLHFDSADELRHLAGGFNSMVVHIDELIKNEYLAAVREKQSELDMLQAQINPHFLYNALDSLYWRVMETGDESAAEDVLALADLFRLVLAGGQSMVTVRHECDLLESYLHIQKSRFGERLTYSFEISEQAEGALIPKLILQPFVENAIVHGFEKGKEAFFLLVRAQTDQERLSFEIRDTGVGMTPEMIENALSGTDPRQYAGSRVGRYAIRNIRERLELLYGEAYSLEILSKPGEGTVVKMSIPYSSGSVSI